MTEHRPQPNPQLSPEDEALVARELRAQNAALQFAETLDLEQRKAFEAIISPVGQVQLQQEAVDTGHGPHVTKFGFFPQDTDMTQLQRSILALIAADTAERQEYMQQRGSPEERAYAAEAKRLRELAATFRQQANQ